jgi:hypothetical protein
VAQQLEGLTPTSLAASSNVTAPSTALSILWAPLRSVGRSASNQLRPYPAIFFIDRVVHDLETRRFSGVGRSLAAHPIVPAPADGVEKLRDQVSLKDPAHHRDRLDR